MSLDHAILVDALLPRVREKGLHLTTPPAVGARMTELLQAGAASAEDVVQAILSCPTIAARIIHLANSPLYSEGPATEDIPTIVQRMGPSLVARLLLSLAAQKNDEASVETIHGLLSDHNAYSQKVARLAEAIAATQPHLDPGRARLAGLVHAIGSLPVFRACSDMPKLVRTPEVIHRVAVDLGPTLGREILSGLGFSEDILDAVERAQETDHDHAGPASYTDIVIVASMLARGWGEHAQDAPAARKLGVPMSALLETESILDLLSGATEIPTETPSLAPNLLDKDGFADVFARMVSAYNRAFGHLALIVIRLPSSGEHDAEAAAHIKSSVKSHDPVGLLRPGLFAIAIEGLPSPSTADNVIGRILERPALLRCAQDGANPVAGYATFLRDGRALADLLEVAESRALARQR